MPSLSIAVTATIIFSVLAGRSSCRALSSNRVESAVRSYIFIPTIDVLNIVVFWNMSSIRCSMFCGQGRVSFADAKENSSLSSVSASPFPSASSASPIATTAVSTSRVST